MRGTARGDEYARVILVTIREVREEHHACTAREIGRRLKHPHQIVMRQFEVLRKAGLVDATSLPGSIHLTSRGGKVASGGAMPDLSPEQPKVATTAGDVQPEPASWPPPPPPA